VVLDRPVTAFMVLLMPVKLETIPVKALSVATCRL
jgi:hypothetical protein